MIDLSYSNLLRLADAMAAAATTFNAHGYDQFISAREELLAALKVLSDTSVWSDNTRM